MRRKRENEPLYNISVASRLVGVSPRVLRSYEEAGLVQPHRTEGKTRLYSERDIRKIEVIYYLHKEKEVNLAGIKIILSLLPDTNKSTSETKKEKPPEKEKQEIVGKIKGIAPELLQSHTKKGEEPASKE